MPSFLSNLWLCGEDVFSDCLFLICVFTLSLNNNSLVLKNLLPCIYTQMNLALDWFWAFLSLILNFIIHFKS